MANSIQIEFNNGSVWKLRIHQSLVHNMADEYAKQDEEFDEEFNDTSYEENYKRYIQEVEQGDFENLRGWVIDSNWDDIQPYLEQVKEADPPNYEDLWYGSAWDFVRE